jgi:hypothetical protein
MTNKKRTILVYARTRGGKTTLIGELAEHIYKTTGKITRVYSADNGGVDSIAPYIELGIVEPILIGSRNPWVFLAKATTGHVLDKDGKWVPGDLSNVGLVAFESMTSFADRFMEDLAERSANGESFGGAANVSFKATDGDDTIKIGGSNMAHYNIVQTRITSDVWRSQRLGVPNVLWTASVSRDDDQVGAGKVLGPEVVGKKLTGEVPKWFQYTFRLECFPSTGSGVTAKPERHVLYLGNSQDLQAGNATSLGNTRVPLDAPALPTSIEPASLVKALELIEGGSKAALEKIRARLNVKAS